MISARLPGSTEICLPTPPYLVEVTANDQSIDFDTKAAPVLKKLTTLIQDPKQEEIHATPLTTLAVNSALNDNTESLSFDQKVSKAVNRVIAIVPVEMSADINLFKDSPVPTKEELSGGRDSKDQSVLDSFSGRIKHDAQCCRTGRRCIN